VPAVVEEGQERRSITGSNADNDSKGGLRSSLPRPARHSQTRRPFDFDGPFLMPCLYIFYDIRGDECIRLYIRRY
jgi:hypothetical protein